MMEGVEEGRKGKMKEGTRGRDQGRKGKEEGIKEGRKEGRKEGTNKQQTNKGADNNKEGRARD